VHAPLVASGNATRNASRVSRIARGMPVAICSHSSADEYTSAMSTAAAAGAAQPGSATDSMPAKRADAGCRRSGVSMATS
jgi:hypothetical protein